MASAVLRDGQAVRGSALRMVWRPAARRRILALFLAHAGLAAAEGGIAACRRERGLLAEGRLAEGLPAGGRATGANT